jgi:hypothetical protein
MVEVPGDGEALRLVRTAHGVPDPDHALGYVAAGQLDLGRVDGQRLNVAAQYRIVLHDQ